MPRGRSRGFAKKIEQVHWTLGTFQALSLSAGTVAVNVLAAQHLPETLMRIRGEWAVALNSGVAPGIGVNVAVGLIQVPEGTGTTVLWSPTADGDAPWIWWDVMNLIYTEQVTDVIASIQSASGRRVIDSKAMRKLRNTELQFVAENATLTGFNAEAVNIGGSCRILAGS